WSDIFLQTKIWNDSQGYDRTLKAADKCLERLGRDHVDMLLIHWPCPKKDQFVDTWKALVELRDAGKAKSIGVSNFRAEDLRRIVDETGVVPAINQIELHPRFQQAAQREVHDKLGITTECWSPLGQGEALSNPILTEIAARYGKSAAQVTLRWQIQLGCVTIPKSANHERMRENIDVFDFELTEGEMAQIKDIDSAEGRIGPDPATADF
ncbi:aldo/keto reductase, partial [Thioclava sp.]|uniref:aldo/keto reductase n=1 Tax=Thioclava sp. TaxID=1933450 RepID=UPI0032422A75